MALFDALKKIAMTGQNRRPALPANGTMTFRGSVTTDCLNTKPTSQTKRTDVKNGRKGKMTSKEMLGVFALGSCITFLVGCFVVVFEMFVWDMTDRISLDLTWRHPERSIIIHVVMMASANAIVFGGGFLAVWIAKG